MALKLLASRKKDQKDILALCRQLNIQAREQAQQVVDCYIPDREVQQLSNLSKTLSILFP